MLAWVCLQLTHRLVEGYIHSAQKMEIKLSCGISVDTLADIFGRKGEKAGPRPVCATNLKITTPKSKYSVFANCWQFLYSSHCKSFCLENKLINNSKLSHLDLDVFECVSSIVMSNPWKRAMSVWLAMASQTQEKEERGRRKNKSEKIGWLKN